MTPNLTELMQRVEEAKESLTDKFDTSTDALIVSRYLDLRIAFDTLLARLLSVIRCSKCEGQGGNDGLIDPWVPCPQCGPDRAAIEAMK